MSVAAPFITYLWHYLVARLLYDDIVRPLVHGRLTALLPLAGMIAVLLVLLSSGRRGRARSRTR